MKEVEVVVELNLIREDVEANIRLALGRGYPELMPSDTVSVVSIVAGGPSLNQTWQSVKDGAIFACNGAAKFLVDRGVMPDYGLVADGRPEIVEVMQGAPRSIPWLVASQCSPAVFDALSDAKITLWHLDNGMGYERPILEDRGGNWTLVGGGSTIGLRAVNIGYLMGAREFHLFGFDSCFVGDEHHCYKNAVTTDDDATGNVPVFVNGRRFMCAPWMISQAKEYQRLVGMLPNCKVVVHGDGLIPWIDKIIKANRGEFTNDD